MGIREQVGRLSHGSQHRGRQRHALLAQRQDHQRELSAGGAGAGAGEEKRRPRRRACRPRRPGHLALPAAAECPTLASDAPLLSLRRDVPRRRRSARPPSPRAQGQAAADSPQAPLLAFSGHRPEHGTRYFKEAQLQGLEGVMAKRAASPYLSGQRSGDWLKIKTAHRQEVVIVGFTAPRRSRPCFGSLVLAVREGGTWRHVGRVGTGFTHASLRELHERLQPLRTDRSPFKQRVKDEATTTWVEPKLVAEVKFTEWTAAGEMRHPAFLGVREDKRAEDVVRETE